MPGGQARMSGTPPRRSRPAGPFALDRLPGTTPRRPRSVVGRGRAFARAASLASSAALPVPAAGRPSSRRNPYAGPYAEPYADHPRTLSPARTGVAAGCGPSWGWSAAQTADDQPPSGGMERPGRVDALRAIDSSARPRSWRTCGPRRLRRHQSCPGSHAAWRRTTKAAATPGDGRAISWRSSRLSRPMPGHGVASGSCRCLRWP
jgi:hypothetical protein